MSHDPHIKTAALLMGGAGQTWPDPALVRLPAEVRSKLISLIAEALRAEHNKHVPMIDNLLTQARAYGVPSNAFYWALYPLVRQYVGDEKTREATLAKVEKPLTKTSPGT